MAGDNRLSPEKNVGRWVRRPGDPASVFGWIFRRRNRIAWFDRQMFRAALIVSVLVLVASLAWGLHSGVFGLVVPAVFLSASLITRSWRSQSESAELHAALPTLTEGSNNLPVSLRIFDKQGRLTGRETGWLSFASGWLIYEGLRSNFSLTKRYVTGVEYPSTGIGVRLSDGRRIEITILANSIETLLPAYPTEAPGLLSQVRDWLREPAGEGLPIFPPDKDHPAVVVERLAFGLAYGALALFLSIIAFAWIGMIGAAFMIAAAAGCVLWTLAEAIRFRRALPRLMD